jgi:hypothetical protein
MTVSISRRVFGSGEPAATSVAAAQPATVCALLRELDMSHACVEKQRAALRTWLMLHEPGRSLRISLCENGHSLLLKQADRDRARPRSLA